MDSTLTVVGTGLKYYAHLTAEAIASIRDADLVLYLAVEPAIEEWVLENGQRTESLYGLYTKFPLRADCYQAITDRILQALASEKNVCVALYGHPAVFAQPALNAVTLAKAKGYDATMLPGISSEDCLFADLLINPGDSGCLSYEATDFIIYERPFSKASHLVLWQVGFIGALGAVKQHDNAKGQSLLCERLLTEYPSDAVAYVYEAAQYPKMNPVIEIINIEAISGVALNERSTLYIPPIGKKVANKKLAQELGLNIS